MVAWLNTKKVYPRTVTVLTGPDVEQLYVDQLQRVNDITTKPNLHLHLGLLYFRTVCLAHLY